MPRPSAPLPVVAGALAALVLAAQGPAAAHAALAAAAGSIFEAAPFVLLAERLPAGRLRALAGLAGCGCGEGLPGALSLAAIVLCWLAFGPVVTFARTGVALALVFVARGARASHLPAATAAGDPFATLAGIGTAAAATALALGMAGDALATAHASLAGRTIAVFVGAGLGLAAPCATAAVAIAAALAPHAPEAAAGVLATGGLVRLPRVVRSPLAADAGRTVSTGLARMALALALAWLAWRGTAGFLNPRLRPALVLGACVSLASVRRPASRTFGPLVAGAALVALAARSPEPPSPTVASGIADTYVGERIAFTGRTQVYRGDVRVERFTITCCRADAVAEAVPLSRKLPVPAGSWVRVTGTLQARLTGLVLDVSTWRAIPAPADPFAYR